MPYQATADLAAGRWLTAGTMCAQCHVHKSLYSKIGRRIVESEQGGQNRASYGLALLKRLSAGLSA
ncbi:DUF1016 domain-containing protein [Cupriavidus basilensis]|nr:DUF1016 domain-containing protein [Cupriavidus basilensis]